MPSWLANFTQHMSNIFKNPKMLLNPKNYVSWISPKTFGYADGLQDNFNNAVNSSFNDVNTGEQVAGNSADIMQGLDNAFTGNLDFQRQLYLQKYNNSFSAEQAQIARDFNALENQKQRDFYENLSNTAYSRQVEDMRNAGLNPYLAVSSGAPVAYGSTASTVAPTATGTSAQHSGQGFNVLGSLLNTAIKSSVSQSNNNNTNLVKIITSLINNK